MEKGTIIFVSHDTGAVVNLCNRAFMLNKGRVEKEGTAKEVAESYLATLVESLQGADGIETIRKEVSPPPEINTAPPRDMRLEFINATNHRNDIELFQFDPEAPFFGKGGAQH